MRFVLWSMLGLVVSASACTDVFDYRLDDSKTLEDTAARDSSQALPPPAESEIWRRSDQLPDGGRAPALDAAGAADGVRTEPARPADAQPDPVGSGDNDDDAGMSTSPSEPTSAEPPPPSAALQQAGWAALTDWAALPTFNGTTTRLFSTHERGAANLPLVDDGNKDFNSFLAICGEQPSLIGQQNESSVSCGPNERGYLVAADDGPGYVSRILLARGISNPSSSLLVDLRPMDERIRIYIDGAERPVFEGLWSEWASAEKIPWSAPLTGWTSGGIVSYLPISYSQQLRVFVDDLTASSSFTLYYVQVNTHRVAETQPFDAAQLSAPGARAQLDALLAQPGSAGASWLDKDVALAGVGASTVWARDQPGTLQRIELQLDAATAATVMNETILRVSWDGAAPAIQMPLSLLFGARHTLAPLSTLPLSVELAADTVQLKLSLPMPFAQSALIELVSSTDTARTVHVRLYGSDQLPRGEWGRLHTARSEQSDPKAGERFRVAALSGRGKYLGTLMYMRGQADESGSVSADELGFLEGDERLEIDGLVAGLGTGTDNYFNGGFYFKSGTFDSPFAAVSQLAADDDEGLSEATMVRWTILSEELSFQNQLALSFEFGADRPATVRDYAAVSFYYQ